MVAGVSLPVFVALTACSPEPVLFQSTDITGASFAQSLRLKDHNGIERTLADFQGKILVMFFGFTQCPDVCPNSMITLAEVKRLLGKDGGKLQVAFITVDPERDTRELLSAYMRSFDPSFSLCARSLQSSRVSRKTSSLLPQSGRPDAHFVHDGSLGRQVHLRHRWPCTTLLELRQHS